MSLVGGGGWADPDALNAAVVKECAANVGKLLAAGRDDRHIFIWTDTSNFGAEFALFMNAVPLCPPELPEGITTAWLGVWNPGLSAGSNSSCLWRATSDEWEILEVPDVGTEARRALRHPG